MIKSLRNYLFPSNVNSLITIYFLLIFTSCVKCQKIGNYVNNGSFENYFFSNEIYPIPYFWGAIDSSKYFGGLLISNNIPLSSFTYQWPKQGNNHLITGPYSFFNYNNRGYPRNRLKKNLTAGTIYCVKMYVNLTDQSTHGIDALGAYFGDITLDTISQCTFPITYLTPQIINPQHSILSDTMHWAAITGTFVANGTEKYMLIGNFKNNQNTDTVLTNPINLPVKFSEYLIDAVSCIPLDLQAYAGPDQIITPGDSVYIGRENDFAIDSGCVWFQLPNMTTAIDTTSGLWVKPVVSTTYVVRQILDCSPEKWDTVVVFANLVGLEKLQTLKNELKIYPVPANDYLELKVSNETAFEDFNRLIVLNNLGEIIHQEEVNFKAGACILKTDDLADGVYSLQLKSDRLGTVSKRFVIAR